MLLAYAHCNAVLYDLSSDVLKSFEREYGSPETRLININLHMIL